MNELSITGKQRHQGLRSRDMSDDLRIQIIFLKKAKLLGSIHHHVTCDETAIDHAHPVRGASKRIENEYDKER